jgi:protein-tyrosine-phosphatase
MLMIGAADTGRAPMAAALLRRLANRHGYHWQIESAGVVGHDGAPPQPETRSALAAYNLDISTHVARSLTAELAAQADLLIAVDSGIARVLHVHYPGAPIIALGELDGSRRDIPDPFRMQIGAWVYYAREMEQILARGFERIVALVAAESLPPPVVSPPPVAPPPSPATVLPAERRSALERATRLIALLTELPDVVDLAAARERLHADFAQIAAHPFDQHDLVLAYVALVQAHITTAPTLPLTVLRMALERLHTPIDPLALSALASALASS